MGLALGFVVGLLVVGLVLGLTVGLTLGFGVGLFVENLGNINADAINASCADLAPPQGVLNGSATAAGVVWSLSRTTIQSHP